MKTNNHFRLGDRVGVLNETLTGRIIEMRADSITIECDDGFNYVYRPKELVLQKEWGSMIGGKHQALQNEDNISSRVKTSGKNKSQLNEVDLHIHELIDSELGMSNFDKLSLQLKTVKLKLEEAISKKQKKIVFIHGKGDGVLKNEVRNLLKNYPVTFHDASFTKYGQGATEVLIFQNKK